MVAQGYSIRDEDAIYAFSHLVVEQLKRVVVGSWEQKVCSKIAANYGPAKNLCENAVGGIFLVGTVQGGLDGG